MTSVIQKTIRAIFPHEDPAQIKREYKLPETINFSLRLTPEGWFVVTMPDHPGLVTQAKSHKELIEMINDAVLTYYNVPKRKADIIYDRINIGDQTIQYQGELHTQSA
ncbi:MAG: hypothetical protein ABIH21_01715 [Patescibacteria group bacterium]